MFGDEDEVTLKDVTSVIFAEGITRIHRAAFPYRELLVSVGPLVAIDVFAFCGCSSLVPLPPFPSTLVSIGTGAFYNCSSLV